LSGAAPGLDRARLAEEAPALWRVARSLSHDEHRAGDLLQATLLRALERSDQYRGGDLAAWLRRIMHRLAVDGYRRDAREVVVEDVEERWRDDAYTVDPAVVVERSETRADLEDALVHLPFIYRSAVVLHDVEGITVREIAELQEIDLPAAKQRLRRGRMLLVSSLAAGSERRAALEGVAMRCWSARLRVSEYMNDDLPAGEREAVERHLAACPTCPPLYAALVGVRATLGRLRDPDTVIPPRLAARISATLDGVEGGRERD
jgi:RNA polymerase sigma-70 factor, ECF subfamily